MSRKCRSNPLDAIRASTRTVAPDRAIAAAQIAVHSLGIHPDRAKSAVREPDAVVARYVIAGVLYRLSRVSYRQVARIVGCGKAAAQARIARFERLPERDAVLATVRHALARIPV